MRDACAFAGTACPRELTNLTKHVDGRKGCCNSQFQQHSYEPPYSLSQGFLRRGALQCTDGISSIAMLSVA